MSRDLKAFLRGNAKPLTNIRYVASDRFTDADGKPIEWELRPVTTPENDALMMQARRGEVDNSEIALKLAVMATVFPDLKNTELQESYGVVGEEELLQALLAVPGEYYDYLAKVQSFMGYDKKPEERIEEAKN